MDWLNLIVERNIGDCHFHDVGGKPSPRAALFYGFFVSVYTSIGIKKGHEGGLKRKKGRENKVRKVRKRKGKKNYVPGTSAKTKCPEIFRGCR